MSSWFICRLIRTHAKVSENSIHATFPRQFEEQRFKLWIFNLFYVSLFEIIVNNIVLVPLAPERPDT